MSAPGTLFYKSSGELLAEGSDGSSVWTPQGVNAYTDKLARLYRQRESLGLQGIVTVSGAGNIVRGEKLKAQNLAPRFRDAIGRLATIQNILMIADTLDAKKIPHEVFVASPMAYEDIIVGEVPKYDHQKVRKAIEDDKIVLVGGGTGTDGNTTDGAVMWYARDHRANDDEIPVTVLKGTNVDGVYDGDPRENATARRYAHIAAETMLADYERFQVVDKQSLEIAKASGLDMILYRDAAHDISEVLDPDAEIGTVIHGQYLASQFAA